MLDYNDAPLERDDDWSESWDANTEVEIWPLPFGEFGPASWGPEPPPNVATVLAIVAVMLWLAYAVWFFTSGKSGW